MTLQKLQRHAVFVSPLKRSSVFVMCFHVDSIPMAAAAVGLSDVVAVGLCSAWQVAVASVWLLSPPTVLLALLAGVLAGLHCPSFSLVTRC
jgi:ABC-type enterobactin transport system permease subunit